MAKYSAEQKKSWRAGFFAGLRWKKKKRSRINVTSKNVKTSANNSAKKKTPVFEYIEEARDRVSERDAIYGKGGRLI